MSDDDSIETYLNRRRELIQSKTVPLQTETHTNLGADLAAAVIQTLSPEAKRYLTKTSECPEPLWIEPNGANVLRPIPNNIVQKALTHQFIMDYGLVVEEKMELENVQRIKQATTDVEQFERFEANSRLSFHLNELKNEHTIEMAKQRQLLLEIFQEERNELIAVQLDELTTKENCLRIQYEKETEVKVQEAVNAIKVKWNDDKHKFRAERERYVNELQDIKDEFNNTIQAKKEEVIKIIQQLFQRFKEDVEQRKQELMSQHIAELICLSSARTTISNNSVRMMIKDFQKVILELEQDNEQLRTWKPTLKPCPNVRIWKTKCYKILKNYEQFIEHTLKEPTGQGKYILPIQKMLEELKTEDKHENCFFDCTYEGGYIYGQPDTNSFLNDSDTKTNQPLEDVTTSQTKQNPTLINSNESVETNSPNRIMFLPKDPVIKQVDAKPFVIGQCEPKLVTFIDQLSDEIASEDFSLSSIEYDHQRYLSLRALIRDKSLYEMWKDSSDYANESAMESKDPSYIRHSDTQKSETSNDMRQMELFTVDEMLRIINSEPINKLIKYEINKLSESSSAENHISIIRNILINVVVTLFDRKHSADRKMHVNTLKDHTQSGLLSAIDSLELLKKYDHISRRKLESYMDEGPETSERLSNEAPHDGYNRYGESTIKTNDHDDHDHDHNHDHNHDDDNNDDYHQNAKTSVQKPAVTYFQMTSDEYLKSLRKLPVYMLHPNQKKQLSIWDYEPITQNDWEEIVNFLKNDTVEAIRRSRKLSETRRVRLDHTATFSENTSMQSYERTKRPKSILRNKLTDEEQRQLMQQYKYSQK